MKNNKEKNKVSIKFKTVIFIAFLIVLAIGVATGVFSYLKKIDRRDNANSLTYLGIMEDGTYYIQDAPKDIRFQVASEDASLYNITNRKGEKVASKIVKSNNKNFIQADVNYSEGESYILELSDGINFTDEALKNARKVKFNITEKEKAEYELADNVKVDADSYNLKVEKNNGVETVSIENTGYKTNDILIIDNYPYKIESIENNTATLTRPDVFEIYKKIDLHKKDHINFDDLEINDEFKNQIEIGVRNSEFYNFLESKVYAADDIKPVIKITPNGKNLKLEIEINVKPKGEPFLGVQSLKEHGVKFKFSIDLSTEYIADLESSNNIDIGVANSQKINFNIEIYSDNKLFKGVSDLSDEEYAKTVKDIIDKLEQAEMDKTQGKAKLISGMKIPTGIWGLDIYFDVYFQTSIAMQLNAKYNQTLEFKQVCGLSGDTSKLNPYSNTKVVNSSIEVEFEGKAETKVGLGVDIGISVFSKDFAQVGLGVEMGIYDGVYALLNVGLKSGEKNQTNLVSNFRIEAGIYVEVKYSASIDFLFTKIETEGKIAEVRVPLLQAGTDEITKSIEASPGTIYVENNKAEVPTIYRNVLNLNNKNTRKEKCTSAVDFTYADGSEIEIVDGKLNLRSNDNTTIIANYIEPLGIFTVQIPVSSTPVNSSSTASNKAGFALANGVTGSSVEDIYKNFLRTKKYKEYTTKQGETWKKYISSSQKFIDADVENYAILDINQDGTPELLCEAYQNDYSYEWVSTLIVTYDKSKNQLILVADISSYSSLLYNSVNKTVQYSSIRPNSYVGLVESYKIVNNTLKPYIMFGYDISITGDEYDPIYFAENAETGKRIDYNSKEEVSNEIQKNVSEINYIDVSNL